MPKSRYTFENSRIVLGSNRSIRVIGSRFNTVVDWDAQLNDSMSSPVETGRFMANSVTFTPDGKKLLAAGCVASKEACDGGEIRFWDVATLQADGKPLGIANGVSSLTYRSDGKWFASGDRDGGLMLWDAASRTKSSEFSVVSDGFLDSAAFSPDGKSLVMGSSRIPGSLVLADVSNQKPIVHRLSTSEDGASIYSVAFSPDGKTLATANGQQGASGGPINGTVVLWNTSERKSIITLLKNDEYGAMSVAFSRDGKILAAGLGDGRILLWDVKTRKQIGQPLKGHRFEATNLAFSADNSTLASAGRDGQIILWDVASRQPIGRDIAGNKIAIGSLALSPDGRRLAAVTCAEGANAFECKRFEIRVWDISAESWIARACGIANRNLTKEEWSRYLGNEPYRETCPSPSTPN
jgi:WD40 repeat protein